jgi:hypothetical protein
MSHQAPSKPYQVVILLRLEPGGFSARPSRVRATAIMPAGFAEAGAFTVDGLGGPFVRAVEGFHNVVGISLPLLRELLLDLGIAWPALWRAADQPAR